MSHPDQSLCWLIDLMDLPAPMLPLRGRPFGPRKPRVTAAAGLRNRGEHRAGLRIDFLDAILGDLKQVLTVEGRSCVRGDINRAQQLATRRIEGVQSVSGGKPDVLTVKRNPIHVVDARKGSIFTEDFGCRSFHASILERFPAKWVPVRVKKTRQNKEIEPPFRFNRNGKGSSHSVVDRGVTRLSGIPAQAGSSNDALARDRTTAPCLLPQANRAPAARCAGWLQARSPGPSSTTTRRRRGRRAPPRAALRRAAPARRPRVRGAAPAQSLASSRSRLPASEAPREAARLRPATVRDAIHRRALPGRRVR